MQIIKPLNLSLLTRVFERENRFFLCLTVMGMFPFEGRELDLEADLWKTALADLGQEGILDGAMPKPQGEVLMAGKCYAPDNQPTQGCQVSLKIGHVNKNLAVFGDRRWKMAGGVATGITQPDPFTEMELTWARAFGGPNYAPNPLGKGMEQVVDERCKAFTPLPNVEYAEKLIGSPGDRPRPASFGPMGLDWPLRMELAGTYDEAWRRDLFPGLARDIDWTYFNDASKDQRIEEYFAGDEHFEITHMHPEKPLLCGQLPRLKMRCFINRPKSDDTALAELDTHLDTVWLFPAAEKGIITHRAVVEVADDEAEDVKHVMTAFERMEDKPKSTDHYVQAFAKRIDPEKGWLAIMDERDLMPEGHPSSLATLLENAQQEHADNPLIKNMKARADREREKVKKEVERLGLDPDEVMPPMPEPDPPLSMEDLMGMEDLLQEKQAEAMAQKDELLGKARKKLQDTLGLDLDALIEEKKGATDRGQIFNAQETIDKLRGYGLSDPDTEERMLKAEEMIKEQYPKIIHTLPALAPLPPEEAGKRGQALLERLKSGQFLKNQDFTGADLRNADLHGADLSRVILEGALLSGANLSKAVLKQTMLARADLSRADLSGADLDEANLGHAKCLGANFSETSMLETVLEEADLSEANLQRAKLGDILCMKGCFERTDFSGAFLSEMTFMECGLEQALFKEAVVFRCLFMQSNLAKADFSKAKNPDPEQSSAMITVNARGAVFAWADMTKLVAGVDSDLSDCDFRAAILDHAGMQGIDLSRTNFVGARLHMADLGRSNLRESQFNSADAKMARFDKADLEGADLTGANLFQASLRKARLVNTKLTGANLYGAEVFRAVFGQTDLSQANLQQTKLEWWSPS